MGSELIVWVLHLFGFAVGWVLLWSVPRCATGPGNSRRPISVIIPSRNEAENLPHLLDSLNAQVPPPEEILVVDDGSTDRTAELARIAGARVFASAPLPAGWRGKAWACQQGADAATHNTLIFMDADTRFEAGGLTSVRDTFAQCGGALSLAAFQCFGKPYEQLSAFFVWVMTAASGAFTPCRREPGLFGPFLMVSKADYQRAGGHAVVKNRVLENVYLAAEFCKAGIPSHSLGGQGAVSIRMYPGGLTDLSNGWKKAFATGAKQTPSLLLAGLIFWLSAAAGTAVMMPVSAWTAFSLPLWSGLYLLFVLQLLIQLRRLGTFSLWTAVFYPLPLLFFFAVFAQSACGRTSSWKGRTFTEDSSC